MDDVKLLLNQKRSGAFYIMDGEKEMAEMVVSIHEKDLTVYHTEVKPEFEGKGLAKKLLLAMVEYARKEGIKVIALCPYVQAQFKANPEEYADIWLQ
jgi:uncharacterized protein